METRRREPAAFSPDQKSGATHAVLYGWFGPQLALRMGDWKTLKDPGAGVAPKKTPDGKATNDGVQLYNLHIDLGETENLAAKHPEKLRELVAAWEKIDPENDRRAVAGRPGRAKNDLHGRAQDRERLTADSGSTGIPTAGVPGPPRPHRSGRGVAANHP